MENFNEFNCESCGNIHESNMPCELAFVQVQQEEEKVDWRSSRPSPTLEDMVKFKFWLKEEYPDLIIHESNGEEYVDMFIDMFGWWNAKVVLDANFYYRCQNEYSEKGFCDFLEIGLYVKNGKLFMEREITDEDLWENQ